MMAVKRGLRRVNWTMRLGMAPNRKLPWKTLAGEAGAELEIAREITAQQAAVSGRAKVTIRGVGDE